MPKLIHNQNREMQDTENRSLSSSMRCVPKCDSATRIDNLVNSQRISEKKIY